MIIKYREADLDYIFIRAQLKDGSWGNLSLNESTDEQFVKWAQEKFGMKFKDDLATAGTPWTSQQKVDFLNNVSKTLGRPAVSMVRREIRNEWKK